MKSENEFVKGVHEKYEHQLEIRRKRMKTLSLCATLSACACVAVVISIRTIPPFMKAENETADAASFVYATSGASYDISDEYAAPKEKMQVFSYSVDDAAAAAEDAVLVVAEAADEEAAEEAEVSENGAEVETQTETSAAMCGIPKAAKLGAGEGGMTADVTYGSAPACEAEAPGGSFVYTMPAGVSGDAYTVYVNEPAEYDRQSENTAESQALWGECTDGYYVYFSAGDDFIVILMSADAFTSDSANAVAESMEYSEK